MAPDLSGSTIVLMHPRTGSSLVMQTLGFLGMPLFGEADRPDMPADANPKGFFENQELLRGGLAAVLVTQQPALLRGRAAKIGLNALVRRQSVNEWSAFERQDVPLILPIRAPAESLVSRRELLDRGSINASPIQLFRAATRNYLVDLAFLAERVCAGSAAVPVCIDYRDAIEDPGAYVAAVAKAARLTPTPAQVLKATANIERGLYRVRAGTTDATREAEHGVQPLTALHDILRGHEADKWIRLRKALPAWAFAPQHA
jgi:hypothetical protein